MFTRQEVEQKAIDDYERLKGKVILVGNLDGYKDERHEQIRFSAPLFARIKPVDARTIDTDIVRWMDDVIDPVYDVEILTSSPELEGFSSFWVYGSSYDENGFESPADFIVPSEDLVARSQVESGSWKSPDLKLFEITLPGYDGGTDATDHLVLWVSAPEGTVVEELATFCGARYCGQVNEDLSHADLALPVDADLLVRKIREADRAAAPVAPAP